MTNNISRHSAQRDSNLELFRCITMLMIVAHHYVVNSGLTYVDGPVWKNPCSWRSFFLLIFGAWGKTCINCFVLITGYYMCKSAITMRKYFKLLAEIYFYHIVLATVFVLIGYEPLTKKVIAFVILPFMSINRDFTGCFIMFYLFIPFLTILVKNISIKHHIWLIMLCLFIYTILEPIPGVTVPMHYVSWFMVLFLVASFLRMHMNEYMKKENSIWTWGGLLFLLMIDIVSIVAIVWVSLRIPKLEKNAFLFVGESNKPLPLLTGLMAFVVFKRLRLPYVPIINILGRSTFGVLLIHANYMMRRWLWKDCLNNVMIYSSHWLVMHAIVSVFFIFFICASIDWLRIRFIELPLLSIFDKFYPSIVNHFNRLGNWFTMKIKNLIGE